MDVDFSAQASEARLKREALGEIERMRRIDEWIPSYRNVHTRAALRGLVDLMQLRIIPKRTTSFLPYTRPGNHDDVRLEAFDHLINLGMMANNAFIRYIFSSLANEPSAYFRDRLWRRIHRGLASIALGETKMDKRQQATNGGDVEMDGFTIDTGESLLASRTDAASRATVEGALKFMRTQLGENGVLESAIMDALRSPIIGLKDFVELLDLCAHLYDTIDHFPITLRYPRYWRVRHLGEGKLVFQQTDKVRTKRFTARPELKRKATTVDGRSESPEAKRRKSGVPTSTGLKINLSRAVSSTQQSLLPSPGASQPGDTINVVPRQPSPLRHESPSLAVPVATPAVAPPKKQASPKPLPKPATIKKGTPASSRASPATSSVSRASPSGGIAKPKKEKRVVLKFRSKLADFARIVNGTANAGGPVHAEAPEADPRGVVVPYKDAAADDDSDDDAPLASRTNGVSNTSSVKPEMAPPPPPLNSIPTPNGTEVDRKPTATPPPQKTGGGGILKLKLNFGAKKKEAPSGS